MPGGATADRRTIVAIAVVAVITARRIVVVVVVDSDPARASPDRPPRAPLRPPAVRGCGDHLRRQMLDHGHRRADRRQRRQVQHMLVHHAEAARRCRLPDGLGVVGAVDAVERVAEIERLRAERVLQAAGHLVGQARVTGDHLFRRVPVGPGLLAADHFRAGPGEALAADRDRILICLARRQDEVERPPRAIDDDRVGREVAVERHLGRCHRGDHRPRAAAAGDRRAAIVAITPFVGIIVAPLLAAARTLLPEPLAAKSLIAIELGKRRRHVGQRRDGRRRNCCTQQHDASPGARGDDALRSGNAPTSCKLPRRKYLEVPLLIASLGLLERMPRAVGANGQPPPRPLLLRLHGLRLRRADEANEVDLLRRRQLVEWAPRRGRARRR